MNMTTPLYTAGYFEGMPQMFRRFTAEDNAAYLMPHLRPGLRVLDLGCGMGSISIGLAKAVDPGELHGVDAAAFSIEQARSFAADNGQNNASFHVVSSVDLPFPDDFFDVANCYNTLMYIPDTRRALTEVKRVLKPGGIIGCREMICDSSFTYPDSGAMKIAWEVFANMVAYDDGHPQMGKDLKGHLLEAGFENIRVTAAYETYSAPREIQFIHAFVTQWFISPEVTEMGIEYGVSSPDTWDRIRASFDQWKDAPDAVAAFASGQAIANKP